MPALKNLLVLLLYLGLSAAACAGEHFSTGKDQFNYMIHCQGCHRADGSGTEGATPDLRSHGVQLLQDAQGREYYVRVPGSRNSPLSDRELAGVLNHIIDEVLGAGADAPTAVRHFSEPEVASYRPSPLHNAAESRVNLINRLDQLPVAQTPNDK